MSSSRAFLFHLFLILPVPAGTNLPTITFSFRPFSGSTFPLIAASVRTLVVSWNDAAEINDSVCKDALVIPIKTLSPVAGVLPSDFNFSLILSNLILSTISPGRYEESPDDFTSIFFNICLNIVSICLSLIITPCNL